MIITIVKAPGVVIEIKQEISIWAPKDYVYFVPTDVNFETFARTIYSIEKERNEWIRRYDNVLQGLQYWKEKAAENVS